MKVSKKKLALYWIFFVVGMVINRLDGFETIGMLCAAFCIGKLSEIEGFLRGYRAAFSGDKE